MRKLLGLIFLSIAAMALIGLYGCGGSSTSNDSNLAITDSLKLQAIEGYVGDHLFASAAQGLELSLALVDSIPGGALVEKGRFTGFSTGEGDVLISSVSTYSYSNGWHIFEFAATFGEEGLVTTASISGIDSLKVFVDGAAVPELSAEASIDSIKARAYLEFDAAADSASGTMAHLLDVGFVYQGSDTLVVLDGSADDSVYVHSSDADSECEFAISLDQQMDNLILSTSGGGCPEDGDISMTASVLMECTGTGDGGTGMFSFNMTGTWMVEATVNLDGSITATYSDGTNSYTVTEECQPALAPTSAWWTQ